MKAFSLVEVLVAVALFAVALTVLSMSINSGYLGLISFETKIEREEDLRFIRARIPYTLSKEALLSGGKMTVPHGDVVAWRAELDASSEVVDYWDIKMEYEFPSTPHQVSEHCRRFVTGWTDSIERSSKIQSKKERTATDNRLKEKTDA